MQNKFNKNEIILYEGDGVFELGIIEEVIPPLKGTEEYHYLMYHNREKYVVRVAEKHLHHIDNIYEFDIKLGY